MSRSTWPRITDGSLEKLPLRRCVHVCVLVLRCAQPSALDMGRIRGVVLVRLDDDIIYQFTSSVSPKVMHPGRLLGDVADVVKLLSAGGGDTVGPAWQWEGWRSSSETLDGGGTAKVRLVHSDWLPGVSLLLTSQGFVFCGSERTLVVEQGNVINPEDAALDPAGNADLRDHPQLAFKIGK